MFLILMHLIDVSFEGTVHRFLEKYGRDIEAVVFVTTEEDEVRLTLVLSMQYFTDGTQ